MCPIVNVCNLNWSGNGVDYISTPITATFTAGSTSTTVNVPVIMDNIAEGPETFNLNLSISLSLTNEVILVKTTEAVGIIIDNTSKFRNFRMLVIYLK